jgi:16S rRNA (guanine(966)-N(2))-methyltransferase RsmD
MSLGKVRIIGGEWRGRYIQVADLPGLRPTADRTRETLFNCLGQRLDGLACLDMFAGTGALGFEAISRGAKSVQMLELSPKAIETLKKNKDHLGQADGLGSIEILKVDATSYAAGLLENVFDITFIDPPFADESLFFKALKSAVRITKRNQGAFIYIEHPKSIKPEEILKESPEFGHLWSVQRTIRSGMAIGSLLAPKPI